MSVTDDSTSRDIRNNVTGHNAGGAARANYDKGTSAGKLLLWPESHDTYAGDGKETTSISTSDINKTWALVASRTGATALYFARPQGWGQGNIGTIGSTQCFSNEVTAVNRFHNYYVGQSEYLAYSGSIAYNERGTDGVILVNVNGGSQQVSVTAHAMKNGTYKDQISGNTFTVSGGKINGSIGSTGIAVVYNAASIEGVSVNPGTPDGTYNYDTDTLKVTLNCVSVTNAKYSVDGSAPVAFTNGTQITLGAGKAYETVQVVTVTGTLASGTTVTKQYTFFKTQTGTTIYFDNSSYNWSSVYAYIYTNQGAELAQWPGTKLKSISAASGYYYFDLPAGYENSYIMWSDGSNSASRRYPANGQPGLPTNGSSHLFKANNVWIEYSEAYVPTDPPTTPTTPPTQPPTQPPTVASSIVYFNPSTIATGDERWAIYTWKGSSSTWLDMTGSGSLYQAALPSGYTNFIVVRMNGATTANNWNNKWNQTDNLTYSASKNYVKATGWGSGDRFTVTQSAK